MAVPKTSKMVTDRQKRFEVIVELLRNYSDRLAGSLGAGGDGPGVSGYLDLLLAKLERAFEDLAAAERQHLDELADDASWRHERDHLALGLRQTLFAVREVLRGAYGAAPAQALGCERRIAEDPRPLLRQGRRIAARLRDPEVVLPPARVPGVLVDLGEMAAALEEQIGKLRFAVDRVTREESQARGTKLTKDRAMKSFDRAYSQAAQSLRGVFHLAGFPELAARVPKVRRRPAPPPVASPSRALPPTVP